MDARIEFRISKADKALAQRKADAAGLKLSEYIRRTVLAGMAVEGSGPVSRLRIGGK